MINGLNYRAKKIFNYLLLGTKHSTPVGLRSDSDNGTYVAAVIRATNSDRAFRNFKRDPSYTAILEHVPESLAREYWQRLSIKPRFSMSELRNFMWNDEIGNPILVNILPDLQISGTTLRYCSVLSHLGDLFPLHQVESIAELGVGYGGQALIYCSKYQKKEYTLIDLPEVLALSKKYLLCHAQRIDAQIRFKTINNWKINLKKLKMIIIKQKRTLKILKISTRISKKNTFKKN